MGTLKEWWPQLLRASGAAALAPAAILVSLLVLGAGGGLGGLGSLSQLFSGPNVPSNLQAAARVDVARVHHALLPRTGFRRGTGPASRVAGASVPAGGGGRGAGAGSPGAPSGGTPAAGNPSTAPGGPTSTPTSTPATTPAAPTAPVTSTPPTGTTSAVGTLLAPVKRIVASLPSPVGPIGAAAITTVVTTVDRLLPHRR